MTYSSNTCLSEIDKLTLSERVEGFDIWWSQIRYGKFHMFREI
jgi:hypothetical protein